jgi:hypothetical protein
MKKLELFVVEPPETIDHCLDLPDVSISETKLKSLDVSINLRLTSSGDFSEYIINDKTLDFHKLRNDIFIGKIKLVFPISD